MGPNQCFHEQKINEKRTIKIKNSKHKSLCKLLLIMLKYIPMLVALFYMINTTVVYMGINIPGLSNIARMSLITWVFIYLSTLVFKFCIYQKLFLYYVLIIDVIKLINCYIGIPTINLKRLMIYSIITGVLLFIIVYIHVKHNKKSTTKNSK